ncbi:NucA/NucB deoxyribonuclease domain-containing protein [Nonomuraea sp. NPDC049028]|uniref:NucA/NucB deoxyribonuclease domain-containing protein n=1 Tax=Nonomuraea sp. NPDC049028 TaxID=3364348 RepID=UPI00371CD4C3
MSGRSPPRPSFRRDSRSDDWGAAGMGLMGIATCSIGLVRRSGAKCCPTRRRGPGSTTAEARPLGRYDEQLRLVFCWNACTDPDDTYPDHRDKDLKGCDVTNGKGSEIYLHREFKAQGKTNQGAPNTKCNRMWPRYSDSGKQCDEFLFASTRERTNALKDNHLNLSLCPITASHNGDAGNYLDQAYRADRVLAGDSFTNRFDTTMNNPNPTREQLCEVPAVGELS